MHALTAIEYWLMFPLAITFVRLTTLKVIVGEDENNSPESMVIALERDNYY